MPKILFWNLNKKNLTGEICSLIQSLDVDVLVLAESVIPDSEILSAINVGRCRLFFKDLNLSTRIKIYSTYEDRRLKPLLDEDFFSVRELKPYLGEKLLLVAVHLPSKLHAQPLDQMMTANFLSKAIRSLEKKCSTTRTIVIGDFNMSPFEDGMVAASGLHAMLDQGIVKKINRTVKSVSYSYFYNPMWGRLGDLTVGPSGTYKYSKAVEVNHQWHTYDQVLLRPSLLDYFEDDELSVINIVGSDHFPIVINLKTEVVI